MTPTNGSPEAHEALRRFVTGALLPHQARRQTALLATRHGLHRLVQDLCHVFAASVDPRAITTRERLPMQTAGFVFKAPEDLGTPCPTLQSAYDRLVDEDGWLIITKDGRCGIHRPEDRQDGELAMHVVTDAAP